jgi:GDP-4-dehydro-6-deoxy-D-mannose reductase
MKALIIGAAGFVGRHLIRHIRQYTDWQVVVTKITHESIDSDVDGVFDLNILNPAEISDVLNDVRPDYIFHLAAQSSVALSWKKPALTVDINIKGTVHVLDAIALLDYRPRVLLIGSGEEYGFIRPEELPINEENALRPGNIYAATKAAQNMIGKIYAQAYNMDILMVRAFNHIGTDQAPLFVVADFCKQVAEIEAKLRPAVINVGNLKAKRDFTDVRDVVRAYCLLMEKGESAEIYNVGSGHAISIEDLLNMILSLSEVNIEVTIDSERMRPSDIPIIEADISKLQKATQWMPEIPLIVTLQQTLDFWRSKVAGLSDHE